MRNDHRRLQDILEAMDEIIQSMPDTRAQFDADRFRRSHVLRYIQIIGEAAARLSSEKGGHMPLRRYNNRARSSKLYCQSRPPTAMPLT
ncbi:MAG TPA: DUF86 domain-containing protein [Candidatus Hydrogenedentes bacterium]|nr:DUF86 domain-containing protein [Candidatus Hydrogenedentota bacterium]